MGIALFALAIVLEQAHVISPMMLAWSHRGLRKIALARWRSCIVAPGVIIGASILSPLWFIGPLYGALNIYHFGAQHFGVVSLCRRGWSSPDARVLGWLTCVGLTVLAMTALPIALGDYRWVVVFLLGLEFSHWLTDVGLSSRVSGHCWLFVVVVCLIGCIGFLWKIPRADHIATATIPLVIKARWGVGIVHFLYSAWIWKLSDPKIRAAIGSQYLLLDGYSTQYEIDRTQWNTYEMQIMLCDPASGKQLHTGADADEGVGSGF
jgi:hypothetical protein